VEVSKIIKRDLADKIIEFIDNNQVNKNILWVYGPGGAGKSSLAKWMKHDKRNKIIFYINYEELNNINQISFREFINIFVMKDNLGFFNKFMNTWIKIENDENFKESLNNDINFIKNFIEKFKSNLKNFLASEEAKNAIGIVDNFLSYIMKNKRKEFEKEFWKFLKEHKNEFVVVIDTFEHQLNTQIESNLLFINEILIITDNEKKYPLKEYLTSLINFSQIKTIIFSRYHPEILYNNLLEDINFLRENINRIDTLELNQLSLVELNKFLEVEDINLNREDKNIVHKLIKNNFAVLKLLMESFRTFRRNNNPTFESFLNRLGIGKYLVSNHHFLVQFLLIQILNVNLNNEMRNDLIKLALYGSLDDKIKLSLNYDKYLHILNYDSQNSKYFMHLAIREAIIFMAFNEAVNNNNNFSIIYNIAQNNVDKLFIERDNSENYLLNKLAASKIEEQEIKIKKNIFFNFFAEDILLFYNEEKFSYLNFYIFFKIIKFYPFMNYDEKSKFIDLLYNRRITEKKEIEYWLDLFGIFYSRGVKVWNDLKNNVFKDLENEFDYLQFIFLAGYKKYIKILKNYERQYQGDGFNLLKQIIEKNMQKLKENIKNILINKKINLDDKYKIIGLFVFYDRKTKRYNFKKIVNELKKDENFKDNSIIRLSSLLQMIKKDVKKNYKEIIKEIDYFLESYKNKKLAIICFLKATKYVLNNDHNNALKEFREGLDIDFSIFPFIDIFKDEKLKKIITCDIDYESIKKYSIKSILEYIKILRKCNRSKAIEVAKDFAKKTLNSSIIKEYLDLLSEENIDKAVKESEIFVNKVYSADIILNYIELLNEKDKNKAIEVAKNFAEKTYQKDIIIKYIKLLKENKNINEIKEVIKYFFDKTNDFNVLFQYVSFLKELLKNEIQINELDENILNQIKETKNSNYLNDLAVVFRKLGDFKSAIECCEKAIEVSNNKNILAMVNCGFSYKSLGDKFKELGKNIKEIEKQYKNAEKCFKEAIKRKKEVAAYYGLGQLYYNWSFINDNINDKEKNLQLAKKYLEIALKYHGTNNIHRLKNLLFLSKTLFLLQDNSFIIYIKEINNLLNILKKENIKIKKWMKDEIDDLTIKAINEKLRDM